MVIRKAARPCIVAEATKPHRLGVVDQNAEQALPLRQVADPVGDGGVHPDVDELLESTTLRADDAHGRVSRTDQLGAGLDDLTQNGGKVETAGQDLPDSEQLPEAALRPHHLIGSLDELGEHGFEFQLWRGGHVLVWHRASLTCQRFDDENATPGWDRILSLP
jgi:hypothetical protein